MTHRSDVELVLDRYLTDGPERVPDRVLDAALDQIDLTSQRRALSVPRRFFEMPTFLKPALAVAAVVAVLVVGGFYLTRGPTASVGGPAVTPSPTAPAAAPASDSPVPAALTDTARWVPYASERYGYQISHPPTWVVEPAERNWSIDSVDRTNWMGRGVADRFHESSTSFAVLVTAFADDVPPGTSEDEWIAAYFEPLAEPTEGCGTLSDDVRSTSVDGHRATIVNEQPCSDTIAFVFIENRVHVFAVWRENQEALLDAFLSTVEFME